MSTLEMKDWNQRDYSFVEDLEDEFEQIPMGLDADGKNMNYGTGHTANPAVGRDDRVRLAKEVKRNNVAFPNAKEARAGRQRGEIIVTE
jgi:hypothetical protein